MVNCFAADCSHRSDRDECKFFRFPKDAKKHALWTRLSRRADKDSKAVTDPRLCSCHFIEGKKENDPSFFGYNEKTRLSYTSPEKKRVKVVKELKVDEDKMEDLKNEILQLKKEIQELKMDNTRLEAENFLLKADIEKLQKEKKKFSFKDISANSDHVLMYTGLPNAEVFNSLLKYVERMEFDYVYGWRVEALDLTDQLFVTLQKLRQNYQFADIAIRYSVSDTLIRNVFFTILSVLHESLYIEIFNSNNIPSLEKIQSEVDTSEFPNCRFLLDTTEVYIENPRKDLEAQRQTFSHYKKRQTLKALAASAPNGVICFTSKLFPGSMSDKELFDKSELASLLNPGDLILADKGFLIHDLLPQGVSLNIPPFLHHQQFTLEEAKATTQLARKRIHVERAFQRIKNFSILDLISHQYMSWANTIFQVCVLLVNLQNPLLKD